MKNLPIITVSVITYNSSRYVIETLESVRLQTYPYLILQICDDCSTDKTIDVCREWIGQNKDRFIETNIIVSKKNTGVSANSNRSWDACKTDYIKSIAGDDLLLSNCIEDNVNYVLEHPEAVVVFSKVIPFSIERGVKVQKQSYHNYDFFSLGREMQYRYLFEIGNSLPAASAFYNIKLINLLGFRHDIRIPLLEDYPKWISFLRMKVDFHFLDIETVEYRIDDNSLSVGVFSPRFYKSNLLFYLYYYLDEIGTLGDKDNIFNLIVEKETFFYERAYNEVLNLRRQLLEIENSAAYRFGSFVVGPIRKCMYFLTSFFHRIHCRVRKIF